MSRLKKFVRLPWGAKITLFEVAWLLLLVRLGLTVLSYERLLGLISRFSAPRPGERRRSVSYRADVTWAASGLGRFFIGDRPCLTQALVVRLLLNRAGHAPELRLGVTKDADGELRAHAWIELDGRVILGGRRSARLYAPLAPIGLSSTTGKRLGEQVEVQR